MQFSNSIPLHSLFKYANDRWRDGEFYWRRSRSGCPTVTVHRRCIDWTSPTPNTVDQFLTGRWISVSGRSPWSKMNSILEVKRFACPNFSPETLTALKVFKLLILMEMVQEERSTSRSMMWPSTWRAPIGFRLMCCRNRRPWSTCGNCWPPARKPTWTHFVFGAVAYTNRMNSIRFGVPEMNGRFQKCWWMAFDSDGRPIGHHDMARLSIRLLNVSDQFLVPGHRFSGSHAERPPFTVSPVHHLVGWK